MLKIVRIHKATYNTVEITSVNEKIFIKMGVGRDYKIIELERSEWDETVETLK